MQLHPYRVPRTAAPSASQGASGSAQFEERCLGVVLFVAGAIGLIIGLQDPRSHGTELVLGLLLVALGLWTARQRSSASSS